MSKYQIIIKVEVDDEKANSLFEQIQAEAENAASCYGCLADCELIEDLT